MAIFAMLLLLIIAGMCLYIDRLKRRIREAQTAAQAALKGWHDAVKINERYAKYIRQGRDLPMKVYLTDGEWPEVIE